MDVFTKKLQIPSADLALPGRQREIPVPERHFVNGNQMKAPFPETTQCAMFGLGCFWGAERRFWEQEGVYVTAAGYSGGTTPNPSYEEVCSGMTGHNEVVLVIFDPIIVTYSSLLKNFWESHNPTQGMQQGNDVGTQYRSGIYTFSDEQLNVTKESERKFQISLHANGFQDITTEVVAAREFYYAEHYHQQYLAKVPDGYCGLGGTGVCYTD